MKGFDHFHGRKPVKYVPGMFDEFKKEDRIDLWSRFPELMRGLGYEMDACSSFEEYRQHSKLKIKPAASERAQRRNILYLLEHADRQIVGNYLFSMWRYYTHWAMGYDDFATDFLRRIIAILELKYAAEIV